MRFGLIVPALVLNETVILEQNQQEQLELQQQLELETLETLVEPVLGAATGTPAEIGSWGPVLDWPHVAVSMATLPDGQVLTYSGSERRTWPTTEQTYSAVWNPATGVFQENLHQGHNMFCAAMSMTSDGQVLRMANGRPLRTWPVADAGIQLRLPPAVARCLLRWAHQPIPATPICGIRIAAGGY